MLEFVLILAIILVCLYIFVEVNYKNPLTSIFFKALASFGFISLFSVALLNRSSLTTFNLTLGELLPVAILFFLGLVTGLIGDLLLALRPLNEEKEDKKIIISGIIAFSMGHVFYLLGLLVLSSFSYLSIILGILMTIIIYIGSILLKFEMGIAKIPALFYTFLIFTMVGQAVSLGIQTDFNTFSVLISIGAILFAVSDLILAPIYFKGDKRDIMVIFNLSTYYAAQLFIAISIMYLL